MAAPRPKPAAPLPAAPAPRAAAPGFFARLPLFTFVIAGALAFRFLAEVAAATDFSAPWAPGHFTLLAKGAADRALVLGQHEWWRLFTASTLHGSLQHLIGNLIVLVVAGCLLETVIGTGWFAAIYFTGALCGQVLSTLFNPADLPSVGASGAIMALLAGLYVLTFHAGAPRPGMRRRVAGALLFPALMPSVSSGAVTDVYAHLGGVMAGTALAFVLLASWNEDDAQPPGRSIAALLAGCFLAVTVYAITLSFQSFVQYARPGLDLIPPQRMPKSDAELAKGSAALAEDYPRDPRARLFRGLALLQKNDLADAEPHLRAAISLASQTPGVMSPGHVDWAKALLALDLAVRGRGQEAQEIATPLCARKDDRVHRVLMMGKLCSG